MAYGRFPIIVKSATFKYIADRARLLDIRFGALNLPRNQIAMYVRPDDYKRMLSVAERYKGFVEKD